MLLPYDICTHISEYMQNNDDLCAWSDVTGIVFHNMHITDMTKYCYYDELDFNPDVTRLPTHYQIHVKQIRKIFTKNNASCEIPKNIIFKSIYFISSYYDMTSFDDIINNVLWIIESSKNFLRTVIMSSDMADVRNIRKLVELYPTIQFVVRDYKLRYTDFCVTGSVIQNASCYKNITVKGIKIETTDPNYRVEINDDTHHICLVLNQYDYKITYDITHSELNIVIYGNNSSITICFNEFNENNISYLKNITLNGTFSLTHVQFDFITTENFSYAKSISQVFTNYTLVTINDVAIRSLYHDLNYISKNINDMHESGITIHIKNISYIRCFISCIYATILLWHQTSTLHDFLVIIQIYDILNE